MKWPPIGTGLAKAALATASAPANPPALVDTSHLITDDVQLAYRHREGRRRPGHHPPLHCPPAGLRRQGTVPRRPGHHRPDDEHGFITTSAYKRPFTPEDLAAIEKKMAELAKKDEGRA